MKRVTLALLLAVFALAGCRPPDGGEAASTGSAAAGGLNVRIETGGAPEVGTVPVVVYLLRASEGVTGAEVEVTGTMTHAGMSPVIARARETEPGIYRADDFEFTMSGDWILIADITLPDGRTRQAETALSVPGG